MAGATDDLTEFTRECLARNLPRDEVERALLQAGWPLPQVRNALAGFAEVDFPVPVPAPRPSRRFSAGEAFGYLVLFTALGTSAVSLGTLVFRMIEAAFPPTSPLNDYYWGVQLRWSIARVVVSFPVFLMASYRVHRYVEADPTRKTSPTRHWITYGAMFVAVCVLLGDLVTLVAYLLSGEATVPFLLKVATVAVIASSILGYYLQDLRNAEH
jgi:hypothetical protein